MEDSMHNVYISGDTYKQKELIKALKPTDMNFKRNWRFDKKINAWHLQVADKFMTKEFKKSLEEFSQDHHFILEILEEIKPKPKSINDYENEEEYWHAFHKRNGQRYY